MSQLDAPRPLILGKGWFPEQLGGLDRYVRDLLESLPEASAVVIGGRGALPSRVTGSSEHDRLLAKRLMSYWWAAQRAAARADLVDAHFALYALLPLLLGRLRGKPTIVHFHGPWADESAAAGDASRMRQRLRRALEQATYRRADTVVVLTSAFRQVLVERYGLRPWAIEVAPPGVDLGRFSPGPVEEARRELGLAPDGFIALAVRRLVPRMGLEVLLEAWRQAVAGLPPGSALVIAGDGALRGALESRIAATGLEASVSLQGRVSEDRLRALYRAADIAVVPTLSHEGFGLVVLEAAACGTPSLVTDVGGLPEAIGGLDPSLVVPAGDPSSLRDRLLSARMDRPSRAATRSYAERFAWPDVADRHRAIARRTVARGRGERLKVVYLDHVARLSGGEIALLRLLPSLEAVNPHVILGEDGPLVTQLHLAGISTEVLPLGDAARELRKERVTGRGVSARSAAAAAGYVARLAARLRRLRPDLVHTNSLKAGVYGSLAARLAGVPMVWHVRDRIADDYLPPQAVWLVRVLSRRLASAVVANSHATLATVASPGKSSVVLYSVLPEVMNRDSTRARTNGGPLTFAVVGRLAPWKGQDVFLRAFASAFPDGQERALVVGGALFGEDEYARALGELARKLAIEPRIEFRGQRPDVWHELANADVLVHASVTAEPFGQVILEGMAAGLPVIAARAGGPAEILEHDVTGLLYEPANIGALAQAMSRMREAGLRQRLSTVAREQLVHYSPQVVAADLQRLYAQVAGRPIRGDG